MKKIIKRLWNRLTFGNSGSSPGERTINVIAVIVCAPILPYQWWRTRRGVKG